MARTVGVDIGSSAVRAVEVQGGRSPRVRKSGRIPLPPGAVEGGQVRDAAAVTKALRRLWHEQKFSSKNVRLGIGSGSVLVRPVELDWMPAQDLRKAMRYLVADLLPVPIEEANIDHVVLEDIERPDPESNTGEMKRMVRVLLVATARDGVDDMVRSVRSAGLRPTTADLAPLALVRAAARTPENADGLTEAIVDVGADKVSIAVHTRGRPRFVRVIPGVGGNSLTRALSDKLGTEPPEAEALKRHTALPQGLATDTASSVLQQAAQRVADEVRDTLSFYDRSDPGNPPVRVVLTGAGGAIPGFADLVAATTGLPAQPLRMPSSRFGKREFDDDLAVSFGLCLGESA
jgi:type IV pilus assembly protein PilM